jgi:hypothetical protein
VSVRAGRRPPAAAAAPLRPPAAALAPGSLVARSHRMGFRTVLNASVHASLIGLRSGARAVPPTTLPWHPARPTRPLQIINPHPLTHPQKIKVTNRDLSIAVLRSFLPMRADEIASGALRRNKPKGSRTPRKPSPDSAAANGGDAAATAAAAVPAAAAAAAPAAGAPAATAGAVIDSSEVTAAAAAAAADTAAPAPDAFSGGGARILEGLAASGLRSIRYALELDGVTRVDANDLDPAVVETMRANIRFNGGAAGEKVHACNEDARLLMLKSHQVWVSAVVVVHAESMHCPTLA